jgi:SRSO17 transposase
MSTNLEVAGWIEEVQAAAQRICLRFSRKDLRTRASQYLRGLISRVERKNGWQLAEEIGEKTPTNLQHFLLRAAWNADEVRDDLQTYVVEHLGAKDGILIIDETGFLTVSFLGAQSRSESNVNGFLFRGMNCWSD